MNQSNIKAKVYQILFAFFSDRFNYRGNDKATFLSDLKKQAGLSEANDIILPIPDEAPPEIPIMFLSKANAYEIKFMRNRIDYTFFQEMSEETLCSEINKVYSFLVENQNGQIAKHVGLVIYSYFDVISENDINTKISKFFTATGEDVCNTKDSAELLLRILHKKPLEINAITFDTNFVITLNSALKINNARKIGLDIDVNTFPSAGKNIDINFVTNFIRQVFSERNTILGKLIDRVLA